MLINFIEPWEAVEGAHTINYFEEELRKEINSKSELYGCIVKAIARRVDCDKVLFAISDNISANRLVVVHLTWSEKKETLPWPNILFFANSQDFIDKQMLPDATEYNS